MPTIKAFASFFISRVFKLRNAIRIRHFRASLSLVLPFV